MKTFIKKTWLHTEGTSCPVLKAWFKKGEVMLYRMILNVYLCLRKDPALPCSIEPSFEDVKYKCLFWKDTSCRTLCSQHLSSQHLADSSYLESSLPYLCLKWLYGARLTLVQKQCQRSSRTRTDTPKPQRCFSLLLHEGDDSSNAGPAKLPAKKASKNCRAQDFRLQLILYNMLSSQTLKNGAWPARQTPACH